MTNLQRDALTELITWKDSPHRKPLVLRGARQVGKSFLVRQFAQAHFMSFAEIDLERDAELGDIFLKYAPKEALTYLSAYIGTAIVPGKTLLFIDEIQARPKVIARLRYFYEELPELHLITAGSLLDIALANATFSMPVGRLSYFFIGPLNFCEYLRALGEDMLADVITGFELGDDIPNAIHQKLIDHMKRYWIIGGMPEVISHIAGHSSMADIDNIKRSITLTYQDDFQKYRGKASPEIMRQIFRKFPGLVGKKLVYSKIDRNHRSGEIAHAIELLSQAHVLRKVYHSSCNGVPIGAEIDHRKYKTIFVDIGLLCTLSDIKLPDINNADDITLINRGSLAEQFVGQEMTHMRGVYREPALYYWMREKKSSSAEVDYVISQRNYIYPIEVKSGKSGTLKSLHVFCAQKNQPLALRFNAMPPNRHRSVVSTHTDQDIEFDLISLPLYMASQTQRLIASSS